MDISFFIVRCITQNTNAYYWRVCYDRIRILYPDAQIFLVDDHSSISTYILPSKYTRQTSTFGKYTADQLIEYGNLYPDLKQFNDDVKKLYAHWIKYGYSEGRNMPGTMDNDDIMDSPAKSIWEELSNLTYIKSEFKGRGEILGYYYFHKIRPSKKAIILHDSVFINEPIRYNNHNPCEFLWRFPPETCINNGSVKDRINTKDIMNVLELLDGVSPKNANSLQKYFKTGKWHGCFGIMSVIDWSLLDSLDNKYNFFAVLLETISTRYKRQCLERIFGIVMCHELKIINVLYGNIRSYCTWGLTFQLDMLSKDTVRHKLPITKVWTGR